MDAGLVQPVAELGELDVAVRVDAEDVHRLYIAMHHPATVSVFLGQSERTLNNFGSGAELCTSAFCFMEGVWQFEAVCPNIKVAGFSI
jgi:hypothetical protein